MYFYYIRLVSYLCRFTLVSWHLWLPSWMLLSFWHWCLGTSSLWWLLRLCDNSIFVRSILCLWQLHICEEYYVFVIVPSLWGTLCLRDNSIFVRNTMSLWQHYLRDNYYVFVTPCHVALGVFYAFKKVLEISMAHIGVLCSFMIRYFEKLGVASLLLIFLYYHKEMFMIELIWQFPNYIMLCKMLRIIKLAFHLPLLFMLLTRL